MRFSGTAVAITNTLIMLGGAVFQPVVGKLLDWHNATVTIVNGMSVYSAADYTYALSVIPFGLIAAIALTFFLKETYCTSHDFRMNENAEGGLQTSNVISFQTRG